ncbi:MAG: DEAD/DEAH box helicase [Marinilabiliaceae bacterium]|nr:DEAD/DEAH box helicase [Marinilabiliaceae bacterium]
MSNREKVISRVQKELIGPGTDLFECTDKVNFLDEIIADKPLSRYFSGILYSKQTAIGDFVEDNDKNEETPIEIVEDIGIEILEEINDNTTTESKEDDKETAYSASTFFPSQYGISFAISKECPELKIKISFGNYKKANAKEIALSYGGDSIELLSNFGLQQFAVYDSENKLLKLKDLKNGEKLIRNSCLNSLGREHSKSDLFKTLIKLFFKDKYKRYNNVIETVISLDTIKQSENQHFETLLSDIEGVNCDNWWKGKLEKEGKDYFLKDYLKLHLKIYEPQASSKYIIKVFIENPLLFQRKNFSIANERLNQTCLFQTELKVETPYLQPFNDYDSKTYKNSEDKMLDFLYREKLSYGIGHNTACTWEDFEDDTKAPTWVSSTFLPQFNVKSQSTDIENLDKKLMEIKQFSSFSKSKDTIIQNLKELSKAYSGWIEKEEAKANKFYDNEKKLALLNIEKCKTIQKRMQYGIELLKNNKDALRAFQLANSAIYLQMFQNEKHFSGKKDGFEAFERTDNPQLDYNDYEIADYPNPKRTPSWRPFQLAFILQCLPSFIEENSDDRDLVDLLYFPTGGGKTEAYLTLSAFLIFWRRLKYPNSYGGVNIIIRYTLRLLSAQQFERATKLILACEFIRKNNTDLGSERITIGFWVGGSTIPNKIKSNDNNCAEKKLAKTQELLNRNQYAINPFQLSNCQWCNTKMVGKIQENDTPKIGHRISKDALKSYCLNPNCEYSENNNILPIVLVDEDIYENPPTVLFATVDKFAQLAWKGEATSLFNFNDNRKPELIIQDELHLLSGPLGSLVGLFENVILSLCTTETQKPKIIVSTATVKNVEEQVKGLYSRAVQIFPQNATNADNTFFSKTLPDSKRRYVGILPTGKTQTMTNLRLNAALLFSRLELWEESADKTDVDQFWTILSYFKSLKHIGRFSNKITAELMPEIKQLQVRYLMNQGQYIYNYTNLPYKHLELTSRIKNEKIKKNLDKLNISFDGELRYKQQSFDIVLATNMISVGLDVGRLGIMLMNGMPPNTAEYIQASSRVARKNEGVVFSLFDPNNTRDLSYFEDFVPFHKTLYKQVEPISVTPFAENALEKLLFTSMVTYFRHKLGFADNKMPYYLTDNKEQFTSELNEIFNTHIFADNQDKQLIAAKVTNLIQQWEYKIQQSPPFSRDGGLYYYGGKHETEKKKNLLKPIQEQSNAEDVLVGMQSMRSVEPSASIKIKRY